MTASAESRWPAARNLNDDSGHMGGDMASQTENPADVPVWSQIWHMPVLILGMLFFGVGLYWALPRPEPDDFDGAMDEVVVYLKANELEKAYQRLKEGLEPHIERANAEERARYEMLWGDLVYQQQEQKNWNILENHQKILTHYQKAQEGGKEFDELHLQRLAETLAALGRESEALEALAPLADEAAWRRHLVLKQIIERRRDAGAAPEELGGLLAQFESDVLNEPDKELRRGQQLWAAEQRGRGLLEAGEPMETVGYLQRRLIKFMADGGNQDLAALWILLAKSYQKLANYEEAKRWYLLAQQHLPDSHPLNSEIFVGLGQIEMAHSGDLRAALELFTVAEREHPTAPAYLDALLGRAVCEARLGAHPEAIDRFGRAVKIFKKSRLKTEDRYKHVNEAITSLYDINTAKEDYDQAIGYLNLLKELRSEDADPGLLQEFARTYERLAQQRLDEAEVLPGEKPHDDSSTARRMAFQEASVFFGKAAEFYLQHAQEMTQDDTAFGQSLWNAAINFDRAQLWDRAIKVYAEFVKSRPGDPRQLDGMRRLGIAYLSDGQYQVAIDLLKQLVEEHGRSPEAYKSLVPLARGHMAIGQFEPAQRVLEHVVTDHPSITPDSVEYRQALIELGKLHYQTNDYELAVQRITEAVDRYGDSADGAMLRFRLADAYRQSAEEMNDAVADPASRSRRAALQGEQARRWDQAQELFGQVIEELEARPPDEQSPIEKLALRNAYYYRGDCAYSLGRFEESITLFDTAARRWEGHPSSLVALVQIVNAYCELGRLQEAKVANDRARWQLQRIPEDAFNDPSLPMKREHWEDWLRWTSELDLFGRQAQKTSAFGSEGVEE